MGLTVACIVGIPVGFTAPRHSTRFCTAQSTWPLPNAQGVGLVREVSPDQTSSVSSQST